MKRFFVLTTIFATMFFVFSCGNNSNNDDKTDTGETVTDEDTVDTSLTDTEQESDDDNVDENDDDSGISDDSDSGNDDDDTGSKCSLDPEILNGTADSYFAFKGVGKIQDSLDWDQDSVKIKFDGIDGKTNWAKKYSAFLKEGDMIRIFVDERKFKDSNNWHTITRIISDVQIPRIKNLMENNVFDETVPPIVSFYDWIWTKNYDYSKMCLIADNKLGYNSDYDTQTRVGKLQVCYEDNNDFSVGETFKVAFFAELVTGQDLLDAYDVDSAEELCNCYNSKTGAKVDCSGISWNE